MFFAFGSGKTTYHNEDIIILLNPGLQVPHQKVFGPSKPTLNTEPQKARLEPYGHLENACGVSQAELSTSANSQK